MKYLALVGLLLMIPADLLAAPLNAEYTEPAGDTTVFVDTSLWTYEVRNTTVCTTAGTCQGAAWQRRVVTPNANGATAEVIQPDYNVPTRTDWLPMCVCYAVTVRGPDNDETAPADNMAVTPFSVAP